MGLGLLGHFLLSENISGIVLPWMPMIYLFLTMMILDPQTSTDPRNRSNRPRSIRTLVIFVGYLELSFYMLFGSLGRIYCLGPFWVFSRLDGDEAWSSGIDWTSAFSTSRASFKISTILSKEKEELCGSSKKDGSPWRVARYGSFPYASLLLFVYR